MTNPASIPDAVGAISTRALEVPARLAHEFADCLWSVLVLAARLDVDLGAAFTSTMDDLESFLRSELESSE